MTSQELVVARQRSLMPIGERGYVEGWMDDDVASAATQLFGNGPRGMLVIDARELLTSTARVVGAQLGELHFKVWMAVITLHVAHGLGGVHGWIVAVRRLLRSPAS